MPRLHCACLRPRPHGPARPPICWLVKPGVNGKLVEKGDTGDLANKLIALLSSPERLAAMGNGERVLSRDTWPAVAARMAKIIPTQ